MNRARFDPAATVRRVCRSIRDCQPVISIATGRFGDCEAPCGCEKPSGRPQLPGPMAARSAAARHRERGVDHRGLRPQPGSEFAGRRYRRSRNGLARANLAPRVKGVRGDRSQVHTGREPRKARSDGSLPWRRVDDFESPSGPLYRGRPVQPLANCIAERLAISRTVPSSFRGASRGLR
jgi:hypothetical protein